MSMLNSYGLCEVCNLPLYKNGECHDCDRTGINIMVTKRQLDSMKTAIEWSDESIAMRVIEEIYNQINLKNDNQ